MHGDLLASEFDFGPVTTGLDAVDQQALRLEGANGPYDGPPSAVLAGLAGWKGRYRQLMRSAVSFFFFFVRSDADIYYERRSLASPAANNPCSYISSRLSSPSITSTT